MRIRRASSFFLLVLAASLPALAEQRVLELDPESTAVEFTLGATGHDVHGTLHLVDGRLAFDPAAGTASGEIRIDSKSAETGSAKRDKTMHKKVLESESHPLFVFRAESLEGAVPEAGSGEVALGGTLTLLGEEHPMTLVAGVSTEGDRLSIDATFEVPYVEWGLHDPSLLFLRVAKSVTVKVSAEGHLAPRLAAAGAASE